MVFTLKRVRDNAKLVKSFVYQDIEDVQKDGDYAVTVTTKRPFGSLPAHLTMLGMLPPSVAGAEDAFFQKPVGTGPFRFVSWIHGDRVELAANPGTGSRLPQGGEGDRPLHPGALHPRGRPAGGRDPRDRSRVAGHGPDPQGHAGREGAGHAGLETQRWHFQLARETVKDPRVRKAISLAIDRNVIIKDLLLGYARPVVNPVPPGLIGHTNLGQKPYDPEKARQLLKRPASRTWSSTSC